ncbi:MAG: threonine-phosphate decarboxylase CobD [Gammaproteobacteria bacterium]|nr:threonine-phosphate decarboxylase CobD [Gammaproteobacteria bacterium]
MLEHGGKLYEAAQRYGIPVSDWLDLSTGINPDGWHVPDNLPDTVWSQLPQEEDGLLTAAQQYYQCDAVLAVAGSQAAIQALPYLRPHSRVGVLSPAYAEHAHAWRQAGHDIIVLDARTISESLPTLDVLVIINPNNPSCDTFPPLQLLDWHSQLIQHGGWLIVDEAFMDPTPENSLTHLYPKSGLIILRSIGKFFGLAGLRVGFVITEQTLLQQLATRLGPWPIAHASRYIAQLALEDRDWQQQTIQSLTKAGQRLRRLLSDAGLTPDGGCSLFQWVTTDRATQIHHYLAEHGILTRLFSSPTSLRFGLAKTEQDWQRLQNTLQAMPIKDIS